MIQMPRKIKFYTAYVESWLIGKDPDAWKDKRQEEKGMAEDKMVGWHHPLNGHEFEQDPGVGDGQGGLACCSPWGHSQTWLSNGIATTRGEKRVSQMLPVVKNPAASAEDVRDKGSIPGSERSPRGGHGNPLQYSCLEKSMDWGAWWSTVHRIAKSQTRLKWLSTHTCGWKGVMISCSKKKRNC